MSNAYKDSLFRSLFNNKKAILSFYNAINGTDYDENTEVIINTLSETLFTNQKNDVSAFIGGKLLLLGEHQATPNANMPLRFLSPLVRLLENSIDDKTVIYREKLVKLPRPQCIVLYNGKAKCPDKMTMKLSDAFEKIEGYDEINLELTVEFRNINSGHNEDLVKKCEPLDGYVKFVDIVRGKEMELRKENPHTDLKMILEQAIAYGITYCKKQNILREFFENLSMEEQKMLAAEWNLEDALRIRWEDGLERGREEGREEGIEKEREWIMGLLGQARTVDELKWMIESSPPLTGKTDETITDGH
jgi:hypothetical protein